MCMLALLVLLAGSAQAAPFSDEERTDSVMAAEFDRIMIDALSGDAQAQYRVGYRYYYGRGVEADVPKAIAFLTRAAKQDHQAAAELLKQVLLYDKGKSPILGDLAAEDQATIDSITSAARVQSDVHISAEVMPYYPGGMVELMKFLTTNIQYPPEAQEREIEGRVVLQLVVNKSGQVCDVKVVRAVDECLDQEAVRVCKMLPNFVPGMVNGRPVNVWYTLPITFKLTD